jgi:hypothetical protein
MGRGTSHLMRKPMILILNYVILITISGNISISAKGYNTKVKNLP